MIAPRPRPDIIDAWVCLWLSIAVGLAAVMTAPLAPYRAAWPDPADINNR